jgi:replicative DNA helicase
MMIEDKELEQRILASLIFEPDSFYEVEFLKAKHFFHHRRIFEAYKRLLDKQVEPDSFSIQLEDEFDDSEEAKRDKRILFADILPMMKSSNLEYYAHVLVEYWQAREAQRIAQRFTLAKTDENKLTKIEELRSQISDVLEDKAGKTEIHIQDYLPEYYNDFQERLNGQGTKAKCCLKDVNRVLGGWKPSKLYVVAARSSMGKSAFVLQDAFEQKVPALVISNEMTNQENIDRQICRLADIPSERFEYPRRMEREELKRMAETGSILNDKDIYLDDVTRSIEDICIKIRKLKGKIGIVYIDLLSNINSKQRFDARTYELGHYTTTLKQLAKECEIPIVLVHQVNRSVEHNQDKRPSMAHLKDSGKIEEDADAVIFLYRPEYYDVQTYPDGSSTKNVCEFIIAKNRGGRRGAIKEVCQLEYFRFGDMLRVEEDAPF